MAAIQYIRASIVFLTLLQISSFLSSLVSIIQRSVSRILAFSTVHQNISRLFKKKKKLQTCIYVHILCLMDNSSLFLCSLLFFSRLSFLFEAFWPCIHIFSLPSSFFHSDKYAIVHPLLSTPFCRTYGFALRVTPGIIHPLLDLPIFPSRVAATRCTVTAPLQRDPQQCSRSLQNVRGT